MAFHDNPRLTYIGHDVDGYWGIQERTCASCGKLILHLQRSNQVKLAAAGYVGDFGKLESDVMVRPRGSGRPPIPVEVHADIAEDYLEACSVLSESAKASAALSRRCLQNLLRSAAGVSPGTLASEIGQVLDTGRLPTLLAQSVDAIRNIGNFSAHPLKSTSTGEILPVEPHEAEWNLEVLEALFDFYYVQPAVLTAKRDALNVKLAEAGKSPMA